MSSPPQLRPLGIGEMLDVSFKLYLRNFLTLVKAIAVVIIPLGILSILIMLSVFPDAADFQPGQTPTAGDFAPLIGGVVLLVVLGVLGTLLATGAAFRALAEAYMGRTPDAGESLRFALNRLPALLLLGLLAFAIFLGVALLTIIPIIGWIGGPVLFMFLAVSWIVVVPVLFVEDERGMRALSRSRELVKGRWWPTFGVVIVGVILIPAIVGWIISAIFQALTFADPTNVTANVVFSQIGSTLGSLITTPLQAAVITVLYFDLRVRREGFDLQLLAQKIGATGAMGYGQTSYSPPGSNLPPPPPPQGGAPPPPPSG